ncbi:hypothetical protein O3P69_001003 [Scylla paramamosain]|uniref:Uncharacterized protein n=1 Tax=Scylla paramamosain TaxID=85552 RepID=A0AAW0UNQ8_SCYPA
MRVGIIYVHRQHRQVIGALQSRSPTRQEGSKHEVNDAQHASISRSVAKEDLACVAEEGSNTHTKEPAAKVRRREQKGDAASGSPDGRPGTVPVGATGSILQGVLSFFKRKESSPSVPPPSLSRLPFRLSFSSIFLGSRSEDQQQEQQQQELKQQKEQLPLTEDISKDKESIPPTTQGQPSAVATLQAFRQESSLKRPRQETDKPGPSLSAHQEPSLEPPRAPTTASDDVRSQVSKKAEMPKIRPPSLRRSKAEDGHGSIQVSYEQFRWFAQLTESPKIHNFLKRDICYRHADKYLLAMVFTYFVRACLRKDQYTEKYFFAALYLAHDMEEDEEELKYEVFPWALGARWRRSYHSLLKVRDDIFWAIHCRAVVSKRGCDQVMDMQPDCWLWQRERPTYHGGATRDYLRDPSDDGRPRGPGRSPLQCQLCLERECVNSENSYLLYLSDSSSSMGTLCLEASIIEHKEGDSGFETFLCEPCGTSLVSLEPALKRTSPELEVVRQ